MIKNTVDLANASVAAPIPAEFAKPARMMSLDALRGFDMFWIVGAEELVSALRGLSDGSFIQALSHQLEHVAWEGFHFEDLIFPMFVFIVGVSLVFSLSRTIEQEGRGRALARIMRRSLLMYLLGIFYYGGFSASFEQIRLVGVLQRIAVCYLCAGLIFCYFKQFGRILWCVGLLVGYWLVMSFVAAPGESAGDFAEGHNFANWVDKQYLPLRRWNGDHDPEGLLSTLPAIANSLIGVFAGVMLRKPDRSNLAKLGYLVAGGAALLALGWLWSFQFPIIKNLWTSSFVLVACGYSSLLLALFYLVIDIGGFQSWARPFVWIGVNPIAIYMLHNVMDIENLSKRFVGGELNTHFGRYGPLVLAVTGMLIIFAIARFLYQRKVFLRL